MPVYQYKGKHYSLNETDPEKAATKIKGFVGDGSSPEVSAPKEPTSATKAYGKALAEEAAPSAAGTWAGTVAGAKLGMRAPGLAKIVATPIAAIVGGGMGYYAAKKAQEKALEQVPESVKEKVGFDKEQRAREAKEQPTATLLGKATPDIVGLGTLGYKGVRGLASMLKSPAAIADVSDLSEVGEKGYKVLTDKAAKLHAARSEEASKLYDAAFESARDAQAAGTPFATSAQGRALLADLEKEKTILAGNKEFSKGQEKIEGINRLINALKGTTTGGYKRVSAELPRGKIYKETGTAPKTTEKDIEAVVEELRFLRDVDAKGKPYEAYAGLSANYKRDLISKLENSLYSWNKDYKAADEAYKAASRKLDPFKTELMKSALRGEKFNPKDLVASPEEFGGKFFSSKGAVQNLKQVVNDDAEVSNLGKEYVATILSNKTPDQIKAWAFHPENTGWLREAGIIDDVQKYATQAASVEKKQKILEKLGYATAGGAAIGAFGSPLYYGIRRTFGL
jgi:hypothetical protein